MKNEFVKVSHDFDEILKSAEAFLRVKSLAIRNAKPIDNFRMDLTRKLFTVHGRFLYIFDNEKPDEVSTKRIFVATFMKHLDPILKKYCNPYGPEYYKLAAPDQIDNIRASIRETLTSISYSEILELRKSVPNMVSLGDKIVKNISSDSKIKLH